MDETFQLAGLLIGIVLAIFVLVAHFRLFSIDKTLKQILLELQSKSASPPKGEGYSEQRIRDVISGGKT